MASKEEDRMYLVCEHKTNGRKLVPNGLSILNEEGLVTIISSNPDICMITKAIQPGCISIDIYKIDLVPEAEKGGFEKTIMTQGNEEVPWKEFFEYTWAGHSFDEIVILVPESIVPRVGKNLEDEGTCKAH